MPEVLPIIDAHVHIYPNRLAEKASHAVGVFYDIEMAHHGTVEELLAQPERMKHYVVHSVATVPKQVTSINDYIYKEMQTHPEFIGFAAMHPDMEAPEKEVERVIGMGFRGIKLHPDFQEFDIDDEKAMEMYRTFAGRLPVLIHMGDPTRDFSHPEKLARVMDAIPNLTVIGAHFAGYSRLEEAERYLLGRDNLYIDTSSSLFRISPEEATRLIRKHGVKKTVFGSDYPMWSYRDELARVSKLLLTEEEFADIYFNNAAALLGING